MSSLDLVFTVTGVLLTVYGLIMFARGKMSDRASKIEAFGIKLDVTNPSIILVLAGVGLMLVPRLLPGQPAIAPSAPKTEEVAQKPPAPHPAPAAPFPEIAQAPKVPAPAPAVAPAPRIAAAPEVAATEPKVSITPAPAPKSSAAPAPRTVIASAARTPHRKPARADVPVAPAPPKATDRPAPPEAVPAAPAAAVAPAAVAPAQPEKKTVAALAPATGHDDRAPRIEVVVAALGLPSNRDFWSREDSPRYSAKMADLLISTVKATAPGVAVERREASLAKRMAANPAAMGGEVCGNAKQRVILVAIAEEPRTWTTVESAYWPELSLLAFDCRRAGRTRAQKVLSPQNEDRFPFQIEMAEEMERFARKNAALLSP